MVRYGIIGSGTMGREHIQNVRLIPEARLVAVALAGSKVATHQGLPTPCSRATTLTWC